MHGDRLRTPRRSFLLTFPLFAAVAPSAVAQQEATGPVVTEPPNACELLTSTDVTELLGPAADDAERVRVLQEAARRVIERLRG